MDSTASICSSTSCLFIAPISTGEPMKGTGSWGWVGALGQMCVVTITSPGRTSPLPAILANFRATATAATAPSPSDTNPINSGLAPTPPRRPMIPSVGAFPPLDLPAEPGIRTRTKSVCPFGPLIF
ncbi:MAG: hypothetical protein BWY79_02157 [Actinobacteria bacterium ADurb.Bin444]|nr:MAG: hypothetical protein BWY79_02157 [Actinobacteria bacterium ADurb.Bin444]